MGYYIRVFRVAWKAGKVRFVRVLSRSDNHPWGLGCRVPALTTTPQGKSRCGAGFS